MGDPSDLPAKRVGDNPLFGAPAAPTDPSPSGGPVEAPSVTPVPTSGSSNPLFGAVPPTEEAVDPAVKERIEKGSSERVESLRRARAVELGKPQASHAPPVTRLAQAPLSSPSPRHSTLIPYLRRLSFILSLLVGVGATLALIWSTFLLPRLHASFSARRALVHQQVERVDSLLSRLRTVRAMGVHAGYKRELENAGGDVAGGGTQGPALDLEKGDRGKGRAAEDESKAMIRELSSSAHSSSTSQDGGDSTTTPSQPLIPDLIPLLATLKLLSSTRGNTSTTRTSLLSTIESYTSALHRQLWNPRPGAGAGGKGWGTGYGLSTLDQSLRNASGGVAGGGGGSVYQDGWEGEGLSDRSEEWDKVRKEVRGIKGILLGRRSMGIGA